MREVGSHYAIFNLAVNHERRICLSNVWYQAN